MLLSTFLFSVSTGAVLSSWLSQSGVDGVPSVGIAKERSHRVKKGHRARSDIDQGCFVSTSGLQ